MRKHVPNGCCLSAYQALERIVLIPSYGEDLAGPAISDDEPLVVCPDTVPDRDLGATAIRLLRDQRRRDLPVDFGVAELPSAARSTPEAAAQGIRR